MTGKPGVPAPSIALEQIRQFRAERRHREALALALDALVKELSQLRDILLAMGNLSRQAKAYHPAPPAPPGEKELSCLNLLLESQSRILH